MKGFFKKIVTVISLLLLTFFSYSQSSAWVELSDSNLNMAYLSPVKSLAFDNTNKLYRNTITACFGEGMVKYSNNAFRTTIVSGCDNSSIDEFQADLNGFTYGFLKHQTIGGLNGFLYKNKGDSSKLLDTANKSQLPFDNFSRFVVNKNGFVFGVRNTGIRYGVYTWQESMNTWQQLKGTGIDTLPVTSSIQQLSFDKLGNVIAGVLNSSVFKYMKWNGTKWLEMGVNAGYYNTTNLISGMVQDATGNLIGYGNLTATPSIQFRSKWNETTLVWDQIPYLTNSIYGDTCIKIKSITYDTFGNIYGISKCKNSANREFVAKYNNTTWAEIGNLSNNGNINAITVDNVGNLYAAGDFTNAANQYYVAKLVSVMPSTFYSFNLSKIVNLVNCSWVIATEINVEAYRVQRSEDGINFKTIGTIDAKGVVNYFYTDNISTINSTTNKLFYRLLVLDKGGSKSYSQIKNIHLTKNHIEFLVYPNPANDLLTISTNGVKEITLLDCFGRVLLRKVVNNNQTSNINTKQLAKGLYFVRMVGINGETSIQQVQFN